MGDVVDESESLGATNGDVQPHIALLKIQGDMCTSTGSCHLDVTSVSSDSSSGESELLETPLDVSVAEPEQSVTKECPSISSSVDCSCRPSGGSECESKMKSFNKLRYTYLAVTLAVMLADGLQGTHLYVLYDSYGYSVPSLYSLGFFAGGVLSPVTGPMIDKLGRKRSAVLYCLLEMFINTLEQFDSGYGLIASRVIGGFTTNLLSSVFEAWLDTEYRQRGLDEKNYEIIMRDSVIVSNSAAIVSGFLAHILSQHYDAVGPFRGAVVCTSLALVVVLLAWTENFGTSQRTEKSNIKTLLHEAALEFKKDRRMLKVGILQGMAMGAIQIFIFLWSPILMEFSKYAPQGTMGVDEHGEPAYGIIFGCFMACGVVGGLIAPRIRKAVSRVLVPFAKEDDRLVEAEFEGEGKVSIRPMAVEFLAGICYMLSAGLLLVPCVVAKESPYAFTLSLASFLLFEFLIGVILPCEGVIRSLYYPTDARGSVMTFPRIIVNIAVSACVASTIVISDRLACGLVSGLLAASAVLQISLISKDEWTSLFRRVDHKLAPVRAASLTACRIIRRDSSRMLKRMSDTTGLRMIQNLVAADDDSLFESKVKDE